MIVDDGTPDEEELVWRAEREVITLAGAVRMARRTGRLTIEMLDDLDASVEMLDLARITFLRLPPTPDDP